MGVSKNRGTPKSSILIEFSIVNHPFWGTPIFGNTHIVFKRCESGGHFFHESSRTNFPGIMVGTEDGRNEYGNEITCWVISYIFNLGGDLQTILHVVSYGCNPRLGEQVRITDRFFCCHALLIWIADRQILLRLSGMELLQRLWSVHLRQDSLDCNWLVSWVITTTNHCKLVDKLPGVK